MASLFKWFKGTKANRDQSDLVVPDGNVAIAKFPSGRHAMYIGDGQRTLKNLPQLSHIYPFSDNTTVKVGGINANTNLKDLDVADILYQILNEYQAVLLNSISVTPNKFEIGQTLSGNITVTCNASNLQNINPGASTIASSGPSLFTQQQINPASPLVIAVTSHSKSSPGAVTVSVTLRGLNGESSTKTFSISWFAPIIYGTTADTLIDTQGKFNTLMGINKKLQSARQGLFDFGGGGYSHVLIPKTMSITGIGFTDIDLSTGNPLFSYSMTQQSDKTFSNGFININFYYFRSVNFINAPTRMQII